MINVIAQVAIVVFLAICALFWGWRTCQAVRFMRMSYAEGDTGDFASAGAVAMVSLSVTLILVCGVVVVATGQL